MNKTKLSVAGSRFANPPPGALASNTLLASRSLGLYLQTTCCLRVAILSNKMMFFMESNGKY